MMKVLQHFSNLTQGMGWKNYQSE